MSWLNLSTGTKSAGEQTAYLASLVFAVSEAKVIFLQQVDVVAHFCKKFLGLSMFLNGEETDTVRDIEIYFSLHNN